MILFDIVAAIGILCITVVLGLVVLSVLAARFAGWGD
jgi:hypothetical protein